jgi:Mn2+/Fe2+ NRAMP family transporter
MEKAVNPALRRPAAWARALDRVRWIGPGLVMAATAIGASHLVLAPTAGAAFGYSLLWLMTFTHVFKYPAFDFGPRYAVATGETLLDGYARVPGPRGWALWAFLAGTVVQGFSVTAGVLSVAGAVLSAAIPGVPFLAWCAGLGILAAALLWSGRFDGLSALSKWMMVVLAVVTTTAFLATPPPSGAWVGLVLPALPPGSIVLAAAILGWMPTGIDVAIWHSMWAKERMTEWDARAAERGGAVGALDPRVVRRGAMRYALADLRIGYSLSFVLAVMFLALGAEVLRPTGSVPQGAAVAVTVARLYTEVLGSWMWWPFLLAALFGMYSTTLGCLDGFPRAFAGTLRRLRRGLASRGETNPGETRDRGSAATDLDRAGGAAYWGFLGGILGLALLEIALLPDPVVLVTVAAVASFLVAPISYALNTWCVTRRIDDPALRPNRALVAWAILGLVCMTAASALFLSLELPRWLR